jgi:TRAP-type C4-dicarboxylate transport system permease small subunit
VSAPADHGSSARPVEAERPGQECPATWPAPLRALTALSRVLAVIEGAGIIFFLLAVIFLATWQFVERNLVQRHLPFFHVPGWADGVVKHSVFLLGFFGAGYATFTGRHIRIDAITRLLDVRKRLVLRVITTIGALVIVSLFTKATVGVYKLFLEEAGEASQAEQLFTSSRGALIMVIGYAVIAFHFLVQIALDVGWLLSKQPPPPSYIAEASAH